MDVPCDESPTHPPLQTSELLELLILTAQSSVGEVSIFGVVESAQQFLYQNNRPPHEMPEAPPTHGDGLDSQVNASECCVVLC